MKPDAPRARVRKNGRPRKGEGPDWNLVIESMRKCPNVEAACEAAGVGTQSCYQRMDEHPDFKAAMEEAKQTSVGRLVKTSWERAQGIWKPPDPEADRPDSDLAKFLLRAHGGDLYKPEIRIQSEVSLAEARTMLATPEGRAKILEMARKTGLIPDE